MEYFLVKFNIQYSDSPDRYKNQKILEFTEFTVNILGLSLGGVRKQFLFRIFFIRKIKYALDTDMTSLTPTFVMCPMFIG